MKKIPWGLCVAAWLAFAAGALPAWALSETEQAAVKKEVSAEFGKLVAALNRLEPAAWANHYAREGFVSALCGTDYFASREAWVEAAKGFFASRERQQVTPSAVRVTALAADLALLTSEEKGIMRLKNGTNVVCRHVFTMIWRKGANGWKIVHSHESWTDAPAARPGPGD